MLVPTSIGRAQDEHPASTEGILIEEFRPPL
jgi:hypothetical protein